MPKRSSPTDAQYIGQADDLESLVEDKRAGWRADNTKARRRQRRYKNLLTQQLLKLPAGVALGNGDSDDDHENLDGPNRRRV